MILTYFKDISFLQAIKAFFKELNVPVNYVTDEPTTAQEILKDTYKENSTFQLVNEVYFVGMIDDAAFEGNKSIAVDKIKSDYDGILIFGVTLNQRENNLLPTRSQLAEISRAFNREFYYTPVVLIFKYADDKGQYIAFANTERLQYKQAWREGEKAGKVSLLRDIDIQRPHRGHEDIINQLRIQTSGVKAIDSFAKLYTYWQEVFSVSVLNKRFYQELSNWYFWAVKQVTFPGKPTEADAIKKNAKLDDLIQEHNATNVIRLLTRLLFTWFIKEKKLIPEELFDLEALQKDILNNIAPYHENGLFNQANKDSVYYRAILQNLFFASLNCPIKPDGTDSRERGFRGDGYGTHRGIDYLMRYKRYFKNPDAFLELMNKTVPFLNGGLFECLDDKYSNTYIDGFSDQMTKGEQLIVPDYLFFGTPEEVDLSAEYGVNNNTTKKAAVKGLINILKSYKFTITENTPIEEDVALDPELLGKVFENLLASYNPETKTTARKQTGSFYTPREIVNYMVDESLIAYLKNCLNPDSKGLNDCHDLKNQENQENHINQGSDNVLDEKLHQLASFDSYNPFTNEPEATRQIIAALDRCKILDPACGSGAFPMGVLQKMVHMLQKLDPDNLIWKEVQIQKVQEETSEVFKTIDDKAEREEKLKEINNAFDQRVNDPDYARKLYLIENCIYGVDIQPIATQISKLRFFISLVVDQKSNANADENFGIRPLPNLETKFVTANTLIGINKEANLFTTDTVKDLEQQLKHIRHKLFSARTKDTKLKYRQKDEELRKTIAEELKKQGLPVDSAEKLAKWDPYDQNASSPFFDPEWMFDIADGFDVVIGNPPYLESKKLPIEIKSLFKNYTSSTGKFDLYVLFIEKGIILTKPKGLLSYINPTTFMNKEFGTGLRKYITSNATIKRVLDFNDIQVFENATNYTGVFEFINETQKVYRFNYVKYQGGNSISVKDFNDSLLAPNNFDFSESMIIESELLKNTDWNFRNDASQTIIELIDNNSKTFKNFVKYIFVGIQSGKDEVFLLTDEDIINYNLEKSIIYPILKGKDVRRYALNWSGNYIIYPYNIDNTVISETELQSKYPNIYRYLTNKRNLLNGRSYFDNSNKRWYELWCERSLSKFKELKIVNAEISPENRFYLDQKGFLGNTKIFSTVLKDKFSSKYNYFLGLLNSKLMNYYHKHIASPKAGGFFDYKTQFISLYPIKLDNSFNQIDMIVSFIIKEPNNNNIKTFSDVVDALVFNLYFPDHMKEREIDVLQFVEQDIEKVMQGREFEKLSDTEKEQVIEQLHQTWSHPENEVVKRMALFKERSPEILKPILES